MHHTHAYVKKTIMYDCMCYCLVTMCLIRHTCSRTAHLNQMTSY